MAKQEAPRELPKKRFMLIVTITYCIASFIFLVTLFGNMPILKDTINLGRFDDFNVFFNQNFLIFDVVASGISFIDFCILAVIFVKKGFPSLFTYITVFWCYFVNTIFSAWLYYLAIHDIYIGLEQIVFSIPVILIFISNTFLIDDLGDLYRGKYHMYYSRKMRRLFRTRKVEGAEAAYEDLERIEKSEKEEPHNAVRAKSDDIVGAAAMAIPELKK